MPSVSDRSCSANAVTMEHVTKVYTMKGKLLPGFAGSVLHRRESKRFYALKDVSFQGNFGESIGLVGLNGSGKSTLANLIGGITEPNYGSVVLSGSPVLIAISMGLNLQMTGLENIKYKGLLIGLTHSRIRELTPKIIEFANIGEFINQPVKKYSSGMRSRLSFAISINIDPDILVIDEALSVGDPSFADKCFKKMNEFRSAGKSIFFVSHNMNQVRSFCDHVIWMEYGAMKAFGGTQDVLPEYERFLADFNRLSQQQQQRYKADALKAQLPLLPQ